MIVPIKSTACVSWSLVSRSVGDAALVAAASVPQAGELQTIDSVMLILRNFAVAVVWSYHVACSRNCSSRLRPSGVHNRRTLSRWNDILPRTGRYNPLVLPARFGHLPVPVRKPSPVTRSPRSLKAESRRSQSKLQAVPVPRLPEQLVYTSEPKECATNHSNNWPPQKYYQTLAAAIASPNNPKTRSLERFGLRRYL